MKEVARKKRVPIPEPNEPAHRPILELEDLLRVLYAHIRDKYQDVISKTFDEVSRDIGFVVATTLPMTFHVAEKGKVEGFEVPEGSPLKGTLMDRGLTKALKPMLEAKVPVAKPGDYTIYLIWPPALRFKLRRDWMEPAHWHGPWTEPAHPGRVPIDVGRLAADQRLAKVAWDVREPVHWFSPRIRMSELDALHVSLLDEVYPDLKLMERVVAARRGARAVFPEVQEPAHFRDFVSAIPEMPKEMLAELAQILKRYGY